MKQAIHALPRQGGILRPALVVFVALSLVTGLAYPFLTNGIAAAVFPHEAAGSLIRDGDKVVGSELIGRPSARRSISGAGRRPPRQCRTTRPARAARTWSAQPRAGRGDPGPHRPAQGRRSGESAACPGGSGHRLGQRSDPHISPAAAVYQAARVARARNLPRAEVDALIAANTEKPWIGLLGIPRSSVLKLNLALDKLAPRR